MKTELCVPSDLKYMSVVERWLLDSLQIELGNIINCQTLSNRLRLVLVEAYSNVVRHAHKEQPQLPVLIKLELQEREIKLEIWDQGQGFNLASYAPPNFNQAQDGGYGWLIITRLMDKVEYRLQVNGKNCLKMETQLPGK